MDAITIQNWLVGVGAFLAALALALTYFQQRKNGKKTENHREHRRTS